MNEAAQLAGPETLLIAEVPEIVKSGLATVIHRCGLLE